MTKDEVVSKIIFLVNKCEATDEECEDCVMCHYCCGYYTGDWTVPPITPKEEEKTSPPPRIGTYDSAGGMMVRKMIEEYEARVR